MPRFRPAPASPSPSEPHLHFGSPNSIVMDRSPRSESLYPAKKPRLPAQFRVSNRTPHSSAAFYPPPCGLRVKTEHPSDTVLLWRQQTESGHDLNLERSMPFMNRLPLPSPPCRSVFQKSGTSLTSERYTKIWIQLINQMERSNSIAAGLQ